MRAVHWVLYGAEREGFATAPTVCGALRAMLDASRYSLQMPSNVLGKTQLGLRP